jgi:hypothetical protein
LIERTSRAKADPVRGAIAGLLLLFPLRAGALELPQSSQRYTIEARLDPPTRKLSGKERLVWTNRSSETIANVPLHLYLNAFAHERTTWMKEAQGFVDVDELLEHDSDPWGRIDLHRLEQRISGGLVPAEWHAIQPDDGDPLDRSLIEVALPEPIAPGSTLELEIDFEDCLPIPIARTGGFEDFFLVSEWYPQIGVLETPGVRHATRPRWVAHQFHAATEFYADFADYEVSIEVPKGWTIGATGAPTPPPEQRGSSSVHRYAQRAVHDFAFVAGNKLVEGGTTVRIEDGHEVKLRVLAPIGTEATIRRVERAAAGALISLSKHVGPYPYDTLTVVLPPMRMAATSGMEYPTLITGIPADPLFERDFLSSFLATESTVIHEAGHQWFYGVLATDEVDEAFLDEGFNTYWEAVVAEETYGTDAPGGTLFGRKLSQRDTRILGTLSIEDKVDEAILKEPSWLFLPGSGRADIYVRPALSWATAERRFGRAAVDRVFAAYYKGWAFRHPDARDFLGVAQEIEPALGRFLAEAFEQRRFARFSVEALESTEREALRGHAAESLVERFGDEPGRVEVEIWDGGSLTRTATAGRRWLERKQEPTSQARTSSTTYQSRVMIRGPAWEHLPVEVELRFSDGAVLLDAWDGRSTWRAYRAVRSAQLEEVRIDPERKIAVDLHAENHDLRRAPDRRFVWDWAGWLGALASWLMAGLLAWI